MKIKYLLPFLCMLSIAFAENEKRTYGKKWHKKHHNVYKHQSHNVAIHPRNHVNIRYGFHWCLTPWRNFYPRHNHTNLVVIKDEEDDNEDNMEIFSQIERLGELKESGLLTEKEFEKAKKDLLKKL